MVTDTETVGTVASPGTAARTYRAAARRPSRSQAQPASRHAADSSRLPDPAGPVLVRLREIRLREADPEGMASTARISDGPLRALRRVAGAEDLGGVESLAYPALDGDGPAAAVARGSSGRERGRVGPLDRHGRPAAHRPLPDLHQHRDARRRFPGAALAAGRGGHGRLRGRGRGHGLGRAGRRAPRERAPGECGQGKNGRPSRPPGGTAHGGLLSRPSSCRYPAPDTRPAPDVAGAFQRRWTGVREPRSPGPGRASSLA